MAHVNCDSIDSATREASSRNHRVALKTRSITLSAIILAAPIAPASLPLKSKLAAELDSLIAPEPVA